MPAPKTPRAVTSDENVTITKDRSRIIAILESSEGKRNPAMAQKLALYSSLDADTAKSILAEAPTANPYLAALAREAPGGFSAVNVDVSNDTKAARLEEIKHSAKAFNKSRGYSKE